MRVFLCNDDPAFCAIVGYWLDDTDDLQLVAATYDRATALLALPDAQVDVVLLDSIGRDAEPLSVTDVRAAHPGVRVIVYSGLPPAQAQETLGGEADLYLQKDFEPDHLVDALRRLPPR
ncbi:MAG: hypothetical protein V7636_1322 [Actinomycetota bacterium]|jgi:DNA-binding NarL/FixJ family response regulator